MYFKNFIYGIIIGIGFIIPGMSGGVLATILGIYDNVIYKINHLFNNFKENILYLLPIFIGFLISLLLFSKLLVILLENSYIFISYIFIGLVLGAIPFLLREIKNKTNKNISFIYFFISFFIGFCLFILKNKFITYNKYNYITMSLGGFFYACGKIIPGISGSSLLMIIGIYDYLLNILAHPLGINYLTIKNILPFIISFIISLISLLRLIEYLLKNHFRLTYSLIIGFIISSCFFIYPHYFEIYHLIIIIGSFLLSYFLSK